MQRKSVSGSKVALIAGGILLFLFVLLVATADVESNGGRFGLASNIEISSCKWEADPKFASEGAVIWQGIVRNTGTNYVESVRVEFTSFDRSGEVVDRVCLRRR